MKTKKIKVYVFLAFLVASTFSMYYIPNYLLGIEVADKKLTTIISQVSDKELSLTNEQLRTMLATSLTYEKVMGKKFSEFVQKMGLLAVFFIIVAAGGAWFVQQD